MHKLKYFFALLFVAAYFASTPTFSANAEDNTGRDDSQVYHIYKDVDLVTTLKTESNKDPKFYVKSVFPQLERDKEDPNINNFNNLVVSLLQQEIITFQHNVVQNQSTLANLPKQMSKNSTLYIDYDTSAITSGQHHLISVRFTLQGYLAGMAHPFHYHRVLNYDLDTGEKIELADLFKPDADYLSVLASYAREVLDKRLKDKGMILTGTEPTPTNYKNWNIKPNGLLITFDEYQVAPYVNGAQTVLVPYAILKPILDKDTVIKDCVNNKKRCTRNNVLTGGFIDTAINSTNRALNPILSKV